MFPKQSTSLSFPVRRSRLPCGWKGCCPASAVVSRNQRSVSVSPTPSSESPDISRYRITEAQSQLRELNLDRCILTYAQMSGRSRDCKSTYTIETSQPQEDRVSLDPWHDIHDFGADSILQARIMQSRVGEVSTSDIGSPVRTPAAILQRAGRRKHPSD